MSQTPVTFLDGRVTLHGGDCLYVMAAFADNSIDSVVTDPPYHLSSIVKRFANGRADAEEYAIKKSKSAYMSRGFMGKRWDGGDIAFRPETWAAVMRVLKPGGHLVAFGAPKNAHRLACAIEDAGFEIRDSLLWLFGSGFPKSLDISKAIDKAAGAEREKIANGKPVKRMIPGADQNKAGWEKNNGREYVPGVELPATPEAAEWEGWGTALKPAFEPIVLARKPLSEPTVAANVLKWGTGALNIGACRVEFEDTPNPATNPLYRKENGYKLHTGDDSNSTSWKIKKDRREQPAHPQGRWPANVVHDGSAEVVEAFPNTAPAKAGARGGKNPNPMDWGNDRADGLIVKGHTDSGGSAARFFYSAKASKADRAGSKHPTVKPVSLMRWLCRLITPPGGTILDCFAGTGTTGEAAFYEGFNAILIEREPEYQADIARRMSLILAGPEERKRAILTEKAKGKPIDAGPLFGVQK